MLEHGRTVGKLVALVMVGVAVAAISCRPSAPAGEPEATRQPTTFPPESIGTVSLDRIKAYADSLHFVRTLGADSELVDFERGQLGAGTLAVIEPESGSYRLDSADLAAGRIIARIYTATEVRQLDFGPWWTWWWVDKRGPGGTWRSIYIRENEKSPTDRHPRHEPMELEYHGGGRYRQALARWEVVNVPTLHGDPIQIASWGSCSPCCKQRLPVVSPQ